MDAIQMTADEVALEGLDGITITSLWIRIENRIPKFPLILDPATKEFIWKSLICDLNIQFFELPKERAPVVVIDRFAEIDPETGIQEIRRVVLSADSREDVYPVNIIQDNKEGIQGSCQFFKERKNVTDLIRTKDLKSKYTLEDACKRWGDTLVVVASQGVRYRALIGMEGDPELKLTDHSYCILERLGRARWQGELQRDLHSRAFKTDAGKMHYLRKSLDRNGLITLQSHVIRLPNGGQQHSILLLLKRFHVDRRSKYDILMEKTSNILEASPDKMGIMINLREQLCVSERTFKRIYQYMMAAKLVQLMIVPLQELNPDGGPYKTKRGTDVMVRCLKLLKVYGKKEDEDEDENDDEDGGTKTPLFQGRVIERDTLTQAYEIVISSGTKGISQTVLRGRMNVGKLEARMICRLLERNDMIKGFMEDEGRQRTTKYISKIFVEQSDLNQQFAKEKARSEQLRTGEAASLEQKDAEPCPKNIPEKPPVTEGDKLDHEKQQQPPQKKPKLVSSKTPGKNPQDSLLKISTKNLLKQSKLNFAIKHSTPIKISESTLPPLRMSNDKTEETVLESQDLSETPGETDLSLDVSFDQSMNISVSNKSIDDDSCVTVVEEVVSQKETPPTRKRNRPARIEKPHQTCRLMKRKNLIIETVRNLKVIESLYTLQKMIMDGEKQDGVSTKCCKKSILRLLRSLSKEGMLKLFHTTVIQDGVSKKVDFVVDPSVTPNDPLVKSAIEQIRFRISSSYSAQRKTTHAGVEAGKDEVQGGEGHESTEKGQGSLKIKTDEKMGLELKNFRPSIVPGLGRSLGFQPKMPRLRLVHSFLWYLIYGHPMRRFPIESKKDLSKEEEGKEQNHGELSQNTVQSESSNQSDSSDDVTRTKMSKTEENAAEVQVHEDQAEIVYVNDLTWRRYIPPTPLHREFGYGWALTSDILLSLPLSIFVQIIQVSYKVDDLETYLNDSKKQHYLIRFLPGRMKKQLLYKRKYIFSFYESMQRLCYMGLLQFGPIEKFQDKDQVFVYLKKTAIIVDTTTCEPHYNLAIETRPFERRRYTFNTSEDVENYWFDLKCVCLNTPLGVIRCSRPKRNVGQDGQGEEEPDTSTPVEPERPDQRYTRLAHTLKGSREVIEDGTIPGDGQGSGGLDSCFFGHLKRNWIWTSYLLSKPKKPGSTFEGSPTLRLKNLLTKCPLPVSMCANSKVKGSQEPTHTHMMVTEEEVKVAVESSDRNSRIMGGKNQKRKRQKAIKQVKKKRNVANPKKKRLRTPFPDLADQSALQRMTRQRVCWTLQEDSLLMLCRVASHFLNRKIKKPFVPWQVVRDLLHDQFEASLDKTSLSVGRRSRYIMKNPQTNLNFKICLAEVYQDKSLIEEFQNRENNYEDPEVCATEFKEFVAVLRQKFSSDSGDCNFEIPDTKEELFRRFKVYAIGEDSKESVTDTLTSQEDIHSLVLNNLIQSTLVLSNVQMKSCRSFQTFHMYSNYKQDVLYKAFLSCQKRGLVNRRRVSKSFGPKKSRALPFLPMSYQLSQSYYRCFSWRFPNTICMEAYEFLEMLMAAGKEDRPHTFHFQDQEGTDPELESKLVPFSLDSPGGFCVASLSLMMLGLLSVDVSIPEHIVVVDSTMVDNEVVKSIAKDVEADDDEDDEVEEGEGKKKIEVKARQASHTNYLLMRGYCVPGIVSLRNLNTNDNIVVNSCTMKVKLRSTPAHNLFSLDSGSLVDTLQDEPCLPKSFTRILRPCQDSNRLERFSELCIHQCGYSAEDLQAVLDISSIIEASRIFGCDRQELGRTFSTLELVQDGRTRTFWQYLEDLINLDEVIEVGGNSARLVAMEYADPWLLHTTERVAMKSKPVQPQQATPRKRALEGPEEDDHVPPTKRPAIESLVETATEELSSNRPTEEESSSTCKGRSEEPISPCQEAMIKSPAEVLVGEKDETQMEQVGQERVELKNASSPLSSPKDDMLIQPSEKSMPDEAHTKDGDESSPAANVENSSAVPSGGNVFEKVSFISRPWRIVDGSLNKPVCKGMLEALLFHIMTKPGLPEPVLMEHYRGVLQPVVVLDLLQALAAMGCVQKRYVAAQPRSSLFSPARFAEVKESATLQGKATPFYEPTVDCCLRLGKVFPGETNWNKWVQFTHT